MTVGTQVYIKNARQVHRMGSKLEPRWTGPYKVTECLTKCHVKLENITTGKLLKNTYHSANLKVFIPRSPTSSPPSSITSADSPLVDITTSPCKRKASLESLQNHLF